MNPIARLCDVVMRAAVASGVRLETPADLDLAVAVMRREVKAFLTADDYAAERALIASPGGAQLSTASLIAACVAGIAAGQREAAA